MNPMMIRLPKWIF